MNSMETTCQCLIHLYSKTRFISQQHSPTPIYLFLPLGLFVGMVWHTTITLADLESGGGHMSMAFSIAKLFLVFIESQPKINGVRS